MYSLTITRKSVYALVRNRSSASFKPWYEQTTAAQSFHSMTRSDLIDSKPCQNIRVWNFSGRCYIAPIICCSVSVVTTVVWLTSEETSVYDVWNIGELKSSDSLGFFFYLSFYSLFQVQLHGSKLCKHEKEIVFQFNIEK